ncbi:MAG: phosphoribosylamine--glycine ligase [Terriglobales bacterium]
MNLLVLGGGGREHALCWKLAQSQSVEALFALPGSDGIAASGVTCLPGDPCDAAAVLAAVRDHAVDLTVVGPEAPLAAGIADALRASGRHVFGPSRQAAQLESSKIFAKEFMARHAIPTADYVTVDTLAGARAAWSRFHGAAVFKADGLAAGKGVVLPQTDAEAETAAADLLARYGKLVVEQRLSGAELSLLAVTNGEQYQLLPPARDHKRLLAGDRGPNTGGMGAIAGWALLDAALRRRIEGEIIAPTLAGMRREGTPFQGVLYCGLMLTADGPRVLEFNVRFGDPEAQAILPCWHGDLAVLLQSPQATAAAPCEARSAKQGTPPWGACVVAAAEGYPDSPVKGDAITGLDAAGQCPGAHIFHAGTRRENGAWRTHGGRVLAAAACGTREQALAAGYRALASIHFRGMQIRRDIGQSS